MTKNNKARLTRILKALEIIRAAWDTCGRDKTFLLMLISDIKTLLGWHKK